MHRYISSGRKQNQKSLIRPHIKFIQIIFSFNMQNNKVPVNNDAIMVLHGCDVHSFQKKNKTVLAIGDFQLLTSLAENQTQENSKPYYVRVKGFSQMIRSHQSFIKIQYPNTTSFLFEDNQNGIYALSFHKAEPNLEKFENFIIQFANMFNFNSQLIDAILNEKIKQNCPDNIQTEDISTDPKKNFESIGQSVGYFFGKINSYSSNPTKAVGSSVSERAERFSRESLSEETKNKWTYVKEKSSQFNEGLTNLIRPVVNGYYNLSDKIGEKFYESENTVIKNVREYSLAFTKSINKGEEEGRNPEKKEEVVVESHEELR